MLILENIISMAEVNLVDLRQLCDTTRMIFATVSPNPKIKHSCNRINPSTGKRVALQIPYGKMTQYEQYKYCLDVIRQAYNYSTDTKLFGTWELNKDHNVHFHLLMYDPHIQNDTQLNIFRRDVMNTHICLKNLAKWTDYMNNIVFVNDSFDKRIEYITKDIEINILIFPYYCTDNLLVQKLIV